ncbi:MAG: hypothetical protein HFH82_10205 [Lachnospiraceae bacterium]|nr:hypothetical protein [Lachnospiraceae bacterium]
MVLYLSSPQHRNLLDFIDFSEQENGQAVKKMVGKFVLKQFVIYDMRNFSHFTDVVLDRIAFEDTDAEFGQAIEAFLTMYPLHVTVIYEGLSQKEPLFQMLLDCGVGNIVCGSEILEIQREINECLSGKGMTRYLSEDWQNKKEVMEQYQFGCKNVVVAVVGAQSRIGTTAIAIGLCAWLAHVGASVCYVEDNHSGHLDVLAHSYGMEQDDMKGWFFEGVRYRKKECQEDVNFLVYDLGSDLKGQSDILKRAEVKILVCGTKPHELGYTVRLQRQLAEIHAWLFCPFVAEGSRMELGEALENNFHKVLFGEYQPEMTDCGCNKEVYRTLMGKYLM